jgi:hypothetical protein
LGAKDNYCVRSKDRHACRTPTWRLWYLEEEKKMPPDQSFKTEKYEHAQTIRKDAVKLRVKVQMYDENCKRHEEH